MPLLKLECSCAKATRSPGKDAVRSTQRRAGTAQICFAPPRGPILPLSHSAATKHMNSNQKHHHLWKGKLKLKDEPEPLLSEEVSETSASNANMGQKRRPLTWALSPPTNCMKETKQQMLQEGGEPGHGKQLPGTAPGAAHHTHTCCTHCSMTQQGSVSGALLQNKSNPPSSGRSTQPPSW